ncbi:hypothetical protein [Daejeonella sp.]|uniref:hypothetical protein n=1 Tax=Daejeonella sp. TaxID=2805397 RepID=UPI003783FF7A
MKEIDSKIYFIDKLFAIIKVYNSEGILENTFLGKKNFPQMGELYSISYLQNYFYITDNIFIYKFDRKFNLLESSRIHFKPNILDIDTENPNPEQIMFYQLNYGAMKSYQGFNNKLIIPIEMELPNLNAFNTNKYYKIAYNFALLNITSFKVEKLFNNWPSSYTENKNYPFLTSNSYYLNNKEIYINHEADTSVYLVDTALNTLFKFGFKPEKFKNDYKETTKLSDAFDSELPLKFKNEYGYFKQLITTDDKLAVRFFKTGKNNSNHLGVQVYKEFNLVNEFILEKDLEVIGYIAPYFLFYKNNTSYEDKLTIFRLKINYD